RAFNHGLSWYAPCSSLPPCPGGVTHKFRVSLTAVTTATASSKAPAQVAATPRPAPAPRYLEQRPPIYFPDCEKVPESDLHLELRTLLYLLLKDTWGHACTVGSDQFLYFDAEDPRQCLAPDAYVGLTPPGR